MKTRTIALLMAASLALAAAGCGTISDMTKGEDGQRLYGGIRHDAGMIQAGSQQAAKVLGILDFPFSFVLDTALLPVTLIFAIFRAGR